MTCDVVGFIIDLSSHHDLSDAPAFTVCGDNLVDGALTAPDSDCQTHRNGYKM